METVTQQVGGRTIVFECPSTAARVRGQTLFTKEPGTIAWIDSFSPGSVFWDIGANIGTFSLYAAAARNCEVCAFEPGAANFYGLNCNIVANGLDRQIAALPIAVDERSRFDRLRMRNNEIGGALHVFGRDTDFNEQHFEAEWMQGAVSITVDDLREILGVPMPNHIKIDVDSVEVGILRGAPRTLRELALKSVLVEVNLTDEDEVEEISALFSAADFVRDDSVPGNTVRIEKKGPGRIYNMIFRRP